MAGPLSFISGLIKPVTGLIDNLHTSDEEKGAIKVALDTMHKELVIEKKAEEEEARGKK